MILELKGPSFKELAAEVERSLLKSCNTEEGTGADNSTSKWEKGQDTECPDGKMVHQKHLDGNTPEMTMPAKTQSLTELGMELVFFKDLCMLEEGTHFQIYLFKVIINL